MKLLAVILLISSCVHPDYKAPENKTKCEGDKCTVELFKL